MPYGLSPEEIKDKAAEAGFPDISDLTTWGYMACQDHLAPLLEQRDRLLSDCKDFISLVAGHPDFQKERKELLDKLNQITK